MTFSFNLQKLGLFAVALMIGMCMSYFNVAHAGIVADMFQEPIDDVISLASEELGNTLAVIGVFAAIVIAWMFSSVMTGISLVLGVGIIWSTMEYFA